MTEEANPLHRFHEIRELWKHMSDDERGRVASLLEEVPAFWRPVSDPQTRAFNCKANIIGYGGAAGGGKAIVTSCLIMTSSGFVPLGDLKIGDTLFDENGQQCKLLGYSEIEEREAFDVVFDDHNVLTVSADHLWATWTVADRAAVRARNPACQARRRAKRPKRAGTAGLKSKVFTESLSARNAARAEAMRQAGALLPPPERGVRTTAEIAATLMHGKRVNHSVAVCQPLELPECNLPVPPYTLGAWLGDGSKRGGVLAGIDPQVWERIEREDDFTIQHSTSDACVHYIHDLVGYLKDAGVYNNKHIPDIYLRASVAQRTALLHGLMDTDGTCTNNGRVQFDNTNKHLIDGISELLASLGIKHTISARRSVLYGKDCGPSWRVYCTTSRPMFHLLRKLARQRVKQRTTQTERYVVAINPVGLRKMRCLVVSSPSRLFLAGKAMIPTHNSSLIIGKALMQHTRSLVLRREGTEMSELAEQFERAIGSRDGFRESPIKQWRVPGTNKVIDFGSIPSLQDARKFRGRPHDLIAIDEAADLWEAAVRFVMGWLRTSDPKQHTTLLLVFNPPSNQEGKWVRDWFAPWLDPTHPKHVADGALLWYATLGGKDTIVDGPEPFTFNEETVYPRSRTFFRSRVIENPYLMSDQNYVANLQALPSPLREQLLYGDFTAGTKDDAMQVIPSAWVKAAQARWTMPAKLPPMSSMGVDIARGGDDNTTIARRHGDWFNEPLVYPGKETPDGPAVAALVIQNMNMNRPPIHLDVIGVGASPYDFLMQHKQNVIGVNASASPTSTDVSGALTFANMRSQLWWKFREALDPQYGRGLCLPPDDRLLQELTMPRWWTVGKKIYIESRDELLNPKRLGRSPDLATAYILALMDSPTLEAYVGRQSREYSPIDNLDGNSVASVRGRNYNPTDQFNT